MDYEAWVQTQMQLATKILREFNRRQIISSGVMKLNAFGIKFDPNGKNRKGKSNKYMTQSIQKSPRPRFWLWLGFW